MFDFFVDIFKNSNGKFRLQIDDDRQVAVQGYLQVLKADSQSVVLKLFLGELEILGENLKITSLSANTIIVAGRITSVVRTGIKKLQKSGQVTNASNSKKVGDGNEKQV